MGETAASGGRKGDGRVGPPAFPGIGAEEKRHERKGLLFSAPRRAESTGACGTSDCAHPGTEVRSAAFSAAEYKHPMPPVQTGHGCGMGYSVLPAGIAAGRGWRKGRICRGLFRRELQPSGGREITPAACPAGNRREKRPGWPPFLRAGRSSATCPRCRRSSAPRWRYCRRPVHAWA